MGHQYPRLRETSGLVPGQSRLRGRSRRHPSLATDAQAWARAVWTPCLPQPRPAIVRQAPVLSAAKLPAEFAALTKSPSGKPGGPLTALPALDDRDSDHAAQGPDGRQRGGEQRVGGLASQDRDPDQDAEGYEPDPMRPPEDHRLILEARGEPEEAQGGEDRQLEPARSLHPWPQGARKRSAKLGFGPLRVHDAFGGPGGHGPRLATSR